MALTTHPFAHVKELDALAHSEVNVADTERLASVLVGTAVAAFGLVRPSAVTTPISLILGGLLVLRGASGRCQLYRRLDIDTSWPRHERGVPGDKGLKLHASVVIERPAAHVYGYWRQFENLPRFMPHLKSVSETDDGISHWVVRGPAGATVEWDAEIINDHPAEMIAWQTLPGAQVQSAGTVRFESENHGQSTVVTVTLQYQPPMGKLGVAAARIFGEAPEQQLTADLQRFKQLVETDSDTSGD